MWVVPMEWNGNSPKRDGFPGPLPAGRETIRMDLHAPRPARTPYQTQEATPILENTVTGMVL
jgi:hypothetical protein